MSRADIYQLTQAVEAASKLTEDKALRTMLSRAAWTLDECASTMAEAVRALEASAQLRAGLMDSMSRHEEIARLKNLAMWEQARCFKLLLSLTTPGYVDEMQMTPALPPAEPPAAKIATEVI